MLDNYPLESYSVCKGVQNSNIWKGENNGKREFLVEDAGYGTGIRNDGCWLRF